MKKLLTLACALAFALVLVAGTTTIAFAQTQPAGGAASTAPGVITGGTTTGATSTGGAANTSDSGAPSTGGGNWGLLGLLGLTGLFALGPRKTQARTASSDEETYERAA